MLKRAKAFYRVQILRSVKHRAHPPAPPLLRTDSEAEFYDPAQFYEMPAPQPEIADEFEHDSEDEKPIAEVFAHLFAQPPDDLAQPPDEFPQWRVIRRDEVEVRETQPPNARSVLAGNRLQPQARAGLVFERRPRRSGCQAKTRQTERLKRKDGGRALSGIRLICGRHGRP